MSYYRAIESQDTSGTGLGSAIFYQGIAGTTATMNFSGASDQTVGGTIVDYIGAGGTNPNGGTNTANQGGKLALATVIAKHVFHEADDKS